MKKYKHFISVGLVFIVILLLYYWFINTPYFNQLLEWSHQNLIGALLFLIFIKIIGIIIPPIPGSIFTFGSIPFIGWQWAFLADFLGSTIGATLAYFIGKKYGDVLLRKIFDTHLIDKIYKIKLKKHREIESIFMFRTFFGSAISEVISYAAGILGINYKNFLIGTIIYNFVIGVPAFFLLHNLFQTKNILLNSIIVLIAIPIFWKFKNRYFE